MKKPEREALREYVDAVCAHVETHGRQALFTSNLGRFYEVANPSSPFKVNEREVALAEAQTASAAQLNAADDRLRALGMLP